MTYRPISASVGDANAPLSAGLGWTMAENLVHTARHRRRLASWTYYAGQTTDDSDALDLPEALARSVRGPTSAKMPGGAAEDDMLRGLRIASPPNMPVALPLGQWPLSVMQEGVRVIVGGRAIDGPVSLLLVAVTPDGDVMPVDPTSSVAPPTSGAPMEWLPEVKDMDAYGELTPRESIPAPRSTVPVELTLAFSQSGVVTDQAEAPAMALYLCILSALGDAAGKGGVLQNTGALAGRMVPFGAIDPSTLGVAEGPTPFWLRLGAAANPGLQMSHPWRQIAYIGTVGGGAGEPMMMLHPPITPDDAEATMDYLTTDIYYAGTAEIFSITIEEIGELED